MNRLPKVSAIMSVYNGEKYLMKNFFSNETYAGKVQRIYDSIIQRKFMENGGKRYAAGECDNTYI